MASSPDVSGIMDNAKELDRLRKEQEDVLIEINKMHKKLQTSGFSSLPFMFGLLGLFSVPKFGFLYVCMDMMLGLVDYIG